MNAKHIAFVGIHHFWNCAFSVSELPQIDWFKNHRNQWYFISSRLHDCIYDIFRVTLII